MRLRLVFPTLLATAIAVAYGWAELTGYLWTDYELANEAPLRALVHGHLAEFFQTVPIDGPSLLVRAPFAFGAWLWGGSDMAIYRMVAVPGLLAGVVLGVALWALRDRLFPNRRSNLLVVALVAGNPLVLYALDVGHPEEILGTGLCVGAVLAALYKKPWLAAVLLGLALGNKAWAVLAIGPVPLPRPAALERSRDRLWNRRCDRCALAPPRPFVSRRGALRRRHLERVPAVAAVVALGEHGHVIHGLFGSTKHGFRQAPDWIAPITHPLIALLVVPATLLWSRRHGTTASSPDLLLLLALLMLARCVLDVANNGYYHLPFRIALVAWETLQRERPPVLSLIASALVWLTVVKLPNDISPDAQCAAYLAWTLPALAALACATFRTPRSAGRRTTARASLVRAHA